MKEALKLALAEFENQRAGLEEDGITDHSLDELITAIKEALAQPEQEPVAIVDDAGIIVTCSYKYKAGDKLYTTPPQRTWVGLTDEEMEEVRKQAVDLFVQEVKTTGKGRNEPIKFGRLVEAKLKEKNT